MNYILLFSTSLFISLLLTPLIIYLATKKKLFDRITPQKIHKKDTPRIGGIGLYLSFLISNLLFNRYYGDYWLLLICSSIIFLLGVLDDLKDLSPKTKFLWQLFVATLFVLVSKTSVNSIHNILPEISIELKYLSIPFSIFFLVSIMNAINLADGLDGLASGISLIATIFLLYISLRFNGPASTLVLLSLVGSIIGFLRYNSYPARVFMGDSGSIFLGFMLGAFSIKFLNEVHTLPFYTIIMLLAIPLLDMGHVIYKRKTENKPIALGDQNHFHYRLMTIGLSHTESVKLIFFLAIVSGTIAVMPFLFPEQYSWFLWPAGLIFIFFIIFITHKIPKDFFFKIRDHARKKLFRIAINKQRSIIIPFLVTNSLKYLLIIIFIIPSFFTQKIPMFLGILSLITAFILFLALLADLRKMNDYLSFLFLCSTLILLIANNYYPLRIHILSQTYTITLFYNILFGLITILASIKFLSDIRARYFKTSILDFLLLLFPLLLTVLPANIINTFHLRSVSMKFLVIFFASKVLFIKTASHNRRIIMSAIIGLLVAGIIGGLKISLGGN